MAQACQGEEAVTEDSGSTHTSALLARRPHGLRRSIIGYTLARLLKRNTSDERVRRGLAKSALTSTPSVRRVTGPGTSVISGAWVTSDEITGPWNVGRAITAKRGDVPVPFCPKKRHGPRSSITRVAWYTSCPKTPGGWRPSVLAARPLPLYCLSPPDWSKHAKKNLRRGDRLGNPAWTAAEWPHFGTGPTAYRGEPAR
jgi:hypothetical protein